MTEPRAQYLPGQPSLRYPATEQERREKAEEEAEEAVDLYLNILLGKVESYGFNREEAIDIIKEGFDRELKL